jgi:hypothetical protein
MYRLDRIEAKRNGSGYHGYLPPYTGLLQMLTRAGCGRSGPVLGCFGWSGPVVAGLGRFWAGCRLFGPVVAGQGRLWPIQGKLWPFWASGPVVAGLGRLWPVLGR